MQLRRLHRTRVGALVEAAASRPRGWGVCRQRRLPSYWFTVLVTLVVAVVIFCEVRICHIAMHEAAPLPVRTAPSARERPARLGLIARRLVLADAQLLDAVGKLALDPIGAGIRPHPGSA